MKVFEDRRDAGRQLAALLAKDQTLADGRRLVVLAIPRGGLPVGAEVARVLGAAFDVVVVRKLRTPQNPELGFGALGSDGHVEVDEAMVSRLGLTEEDVRAEIEDRQRVIASRLALFRSVVPPVDLSDASVIVVDDGIATGGTAREACNLARREGATRVVLAVPVAPPRAADELTGAADRILVLSEPAEFLAVGQAYKEFGQLDDEASLEVLREFRDEAE
ncbi:MAG: phosphoribosyltransferase [Egibacteraceae bacterium]